MGDLIDLGLRAWKWLYRQHFRIPRLLYALIAVAGGALLIEAAERGRHGYGIAVGTVGLVFGLQGLIRWNWLSHPRPVLAVAVFACADKGRALEVQRTIMTTLHDHLGRSFPLRILSIDEVVAASDAGHAAALRRRLHSLYLLFGDIRIATNGDVAVFARLIQPSRGPIQHIDEFTEEKIPQRTLWQEVLYRLTSGRADIEIEYPFAFANELTSLLRSLEGKAYLLLSQPQRAEQLLTEALRPVAESQSHAIDDLRVDLAKSIFEQGRRDEALAVMKARAEQGNASPELLRNLSRYAVGREDGALPVEYGPSTATLYGEAIGYLRIAAADRSDEERELTLYNLAQLLAASGRVDEADEISDDLLASRRSHYSRAWYVMRLKGVRLWERAKALYDAGDTDAARTAFAAAAHWYARAIWHRPKLDYFPPTRFTRPRLRSIPVPPKMYGNTFDAHKRAGHKLRARLYGWREKRSRRRCLKMGERAMKNAQPNQADDLFAWAIVGRRDDWDLHAHLLRSFAQKGIADEQRAQGFDRQADDHEAVSRAELAAAFAIDAQHARETIERTTGLDLSGFLDEQD